MSLLTTGQRDQILTGQGVRINGEKFQWLRVLKGETYVAKIDGASHNVTIDEMHICKKGQVGVCIGVKGGYFFIGKVRRAGAGRPPLPPRPLSRAPLTEPHHRFLPRLPQYAEPGGMSPAGPNCQAALAIGFYWAVGPDA